jgi:hypothetical protein
MSTFNQGVPGVPTLINSSAVLVTGNAASANALTVRQFGTGNVFSAQTSSGGSALFVGATNPSYTLDVSGNGRINTGSSNIILGSGQGLGQGGFYVYPQSAVPGTSWNIGAGLQGGTANAITFVSGTNVGIGTTSPSALLHVNGGDILAGSNIYGGAGNTTWRLQPQYVNSAPFPCNFRIANGWDPIAGTGQANYAGVGINLNSYQGGSQIEFYTSSTNNAVPTQRMLIASGGNVGIGTVSPSTALHVQNDTGITVMSTNGAQSITHTYTGFTTNGGGYSGFTTGSGVVSFRSGGSGGVTLATSATAWTALSDSRLKNIIEPISNALTKVDILNPIMYSWKTDETNEPHPGLIAQDVLQVQPEAVSTDKDGMYGVRYTELIPLAFAAIKELSAENTALEQSLATAAADVSSLKTQMASLEQRLAALESKLAA